MLPEQVAPFLYRVFVLHKAEKMAKQAYRMQRGRLNTGLNVRTWGCATLSNEQEPHTPSYVCGVSPRVSPHTLTIRNSWASRQLHGNCAPNALLAWFR